MSASKKMQIVEWITFHLHRNTFAEMKFTDETKRQFQVPWVHKSNRRWNENTAAVFKAWAEYKGKPKKAKVRRNSSGTDYSSQDRSSQHSPTSVPSTSQHQEDIPTVCTEDRFAVASHQPEEDLRFDQEFLAAFASDTTSDPFEIKDLLPEDGDFIKLPSCQELLARRQPEEEFSKPYCDTRYIPQYESISDMEVPSPDSSSVTCSPGGSSDDTSGDNFSLYGYTRWSQDLESHCQVADYTDNAPEYCFSDIETWERVENALDQLFVRSFC